LLSLKIKRRYAMTAVQTSKETKDTNILIVDDEQSVSRLLARYLEEAGYTCQTAESAASARELLSQQLFDLALCDLDMPGESGLDLIRHIKAHHPETGRVMVTSSSDSDTTKEILEVGVYGYILKPFSRSTLLITVQNALQHLRLDCDIQRHKKALEEEVWARTEKLSTIMDNLNVGVVMFTPDLHIIEMNKQVRQWFPDVELHPQKCCYQLFPEPKKESFCDDCPVVDALQQGKTVEVIKQVTTRQGKRDFRIAASPIHDKEGKIIAGVGLYVDITQRLILEQELRQAQKIEAIGQLAAGITHEINTPVQYVGHNLNFLQEAFQDISGVLEAYHRMYTAVKSGEAVSGDILRNLEEAIEAADIDYLREEIPKTVAQGIEGIQRVEKIVRAMKEFSHPGTDEKIKVNINELLESTLTLSRNQWKYVADLETDFQADLPLVPCMPGEINQVFLNLIVNAAHAIEGTNTVGGTDLGKIRITTRGTKDTVQIRISDSGGGIPESIQDRIFEAFFTTKEMGKGTGQGLAIARRVVIDKHQGSLSFETAPGKGTTFIIDLPLNPQV
ncbi:MAG: response regulator, partial [Desulfoprunum sp.]|nr:response regulator [Desulfoprunum sp.]